MISLKVYGIPTCSTCKKALQWLDQHKIAYEFINTKQEPPTPAQITDWVATLGNKPLRNTSGQSYRALGATKDTWEDADWISAFSQDAMLLKRPLFVQDDRAIFVGFRDPAKLAQVLAI
jgi:arsenate reductase